MGSGMGVVLLCCLVITSTLTIPHAGCHLNCPNIPHSTYASGSYTARLVFQRVDTWLNELRLPADWLKEGTLSFPDRRLAQVSRTSPPLAMSEEEFVYEAGRMLGAGMITLSAWHPPISLGDGLKRARKQRGPRREDSIRGGGRSEETQGNSEVRCQC